jgi:uncharacterized membrane protein
VLAGLVVDDAGAPIPGAAVHLGAGGPTLASWDDGSFTQDGLDAGELEVTVELLGKKSATTRVTIVGGQTARIRVVLETANQDGQIRGQVRSFDGKALDATIRVADREVHARKGEFEINLPPGEYAVEVRASGYSTQTRKVTVEAQGVVLLNVELRKR